MSSCSWALGKGKHFVLVLAGIVELELPSLAHVLPKIRSTLFVRIFCWGKYLVRVTVVELSAPPASAPASDSIEWPFRTSSQ